MRLLVDANVSPRTVAALATAGHDVVRARERLAPEAPDEAILALAASEHRVIVTHDLDFGTILALSGARTPSVIELRLRSPTPDETNAALLRVLPLIEVALDEGAVVVVEDARTRVRHLPAGAAPR